MALVAVSLFLTVATIGIVSIRREQSAALRSLEQQGYALADALAEAFLANHLRGDDDLIRELASEVVAGSHSSERRCPLYLLVLASDGRILFEHGGDELSSELSELLNANAIRTDEVHLTNRVSTLAGVEVLDLKARMVIPELLGGWRCYGSVRLGLSLEPLEQQAANTFATVGLLAISALLVGLGATYLTTRRLINSLLYVGRRIRDIASGDLRQQTQFIGSDEISQLEQSVNRLAEDLQKRDLLKQYISRSAWDEIEKKVAAGGTEASDNDDSALRKVTILFMDIRNFTSLAESSPSREVVELLNEIFGMMVDIIETYGGVLDKFIGDALLTVFYPEDVDDDAIRAVYCAVEMQLRLEQFNQRRAFYGRHSVRAGIGINSGHVIAGTIGAKTRKDYTVIGDPVNVAARLEERSKEGRYTNIVISEETYAGVKGLVAVELLSGDQIRGRQKPVAVYEIMNVKDVDAILSLLHSSDGDLRENAFKAVEARRDERALPVLVDILESGDEDVVLRAMVVLGRLGRRDERIGPVLTRVIECAPSARILATALRAAAHQQAPIDANFLRTYLSHEDGRVRANTIEALDILGQGQYSDWIEPLMYDSNGRVRGNAAVALWKRGRQDVGSILERLSYSEDNKERASAVFAAGELFRLASRDRSLNVGKPCDEPSRGQGFIDELYHYRKLSGIIKRLLEDDDSGVCEQAIYAAGKARDPMTLEGLAKNLDEKKGEQRLAVLESMSKIGLPGPLRRLVDQMMGEEEPCGS